MTRAQGDGATWTFLPRIDGVCALIRDFDWSSTSVGAIDTWPLSLKTVVGLALRSPVAMVVLWNADGVMIYNDAYAVFGGERHPQLLGQPVRTAWPEVADFNDNVMRTCMAGGTLSYQDQELSLQRPGRSAQAWMDLHYSPIVDEGGTTRGVVAIVVETTERVQTARAVASASEWQRRQFDQAPGFISLMSGPDHVVDFVNQVHREVFGSHDWVGKPVRQAIPSIEGQGFFELLDKVYATGTSLEAKGAEMTFRRTPDGPAEQHFFNFVYAPIFDDSGGIRGVFCDGVDVTAVHRSQKALQASEARLRHLNADLERRVIERTQARGKTWQLTPDLLGALKPDGFFQTCNPAWTSVLGWTEAEVEATSAFELIHPEDVESSREGVERLFNGQPVLRFLNRYRCKQGGYRWISWDCVPEDGLVYCSGRDITEEKLAEAELARTQEALRQSQKMEAVGQLTGGIAHDFNNLLTTIAGSLEMVERRLSEGRVAGVERFLDAAQGSTRRAAVLTQRLLAFSRRQTLAPRALDVNRLVGGMEDLIRRTVGPRVQVDVVGAGGLWLTRADASQLENALLNLVINARDAMPEGGRMTIETANKWLDVHAARDRDLPPGQYISLCVTDTGVGMSAEVQSRAFDPFFTTKPLGQGTGLGLSMIHGFVRQSGGQVRIYSEDGKGTTMCIYLPRYIGVAESAPEPAEARPEMSTGETILVVDDEASIREVMNVVLADAGYRVLEAGDGETGLECLMANPDVDLLITDVGLPGALNGRQLADAARVSLPHLPILFITGYAENAVFENGHVERGMQVLTKPFSLSVLTERIRSILDARGARASGRAET